ncbi:DegQ family serine endoprotease [Rivibacter subsaxonicus]|uniref:Probable periplasmic serine endoprotease DegP-like n=1 Tax=Rivibacter subsaxonicus TaxID=457575 RepID=A0A4Q7VGU8_9BURK|nr:DegQ family serine endoprotease [Rivibacter subsaxonicus]RZT95273.1 serine protease Do [Rivibacter subsaxonicus]
MRTKLENLSQRAPALRLWGFAAAGVVAAGVAATALTPPSVSHAQAQSPAAVAAARGLPDFADLAEQISPSVVNIRTTVRNGGANAGPGRGGAPEGDEEMQEFFRRYFGVPPGQMPGQPGQPRRGGPRQQQPGAEEETPRGVGSGFIFSNDGYVMTNAHVVDGADEVYVTLTDKREFKAKVIGADKRTDVAVVKIEAAGLPAVKIGDVNKLRVGEWVMAIGSPFGLESSVTAGIVSAKARDTGEYVPFIQTDVAINPGNSGGPLLNLRGEVVGINSQILSRSGGYMGIAFAIPIDEATRVADQLRGSGRVVRGRIGVQIGEVTKEVAESLGLGKASGALVRGVESGGPADKAGLEAGDIVTRFEGKPVEKSSDLPRLVGNTKPGTKATVQVFRRGATRDLNVMVAELEPDATQKAQAPAAGGKAAPAAAAASMGLGLADLSDAQKRELKVKGGVRIDSVEGSAARAGLREGDVILAVANTEVADIKQFEAVVAKLDKSKPVSVLFRRGEWAQYALVRPTTSR